MEQLRHLPIAKSNANRLLIMAYLAGEFLRVREALLLQRDWEDCPDDVRIMCRVLQEMGETSGAEASSDTPFTLLDVGAAGTVLRFVTALAAVVTERPLQVTGTTRLKNRPLRPLLDELKALGADIRGEWKEDKAHAPLTIYPPSRPLRGGALSSTFDRQSSQFISALLMIAPYFSAPFTILEPPRRGNSYPYIDLTLAMMREAGADWSYTETGVVVKPGGYSGDRLLEMARAPEMDWSAASYAFGWSAVARRPVFLPSLRASNRQGDKAIVGFMRPLGVEARFLEGGGVELIPTDVPRLACYTPEGLNEVPDLVPTLVVTALMRRQPFLMKGGAIVFGSLWRRQPSSDFVYMRATTRWHGMVHSLLWRRSVLSSWIRRRIIGWQWRGLLRAFFTPKCSTRMLRSYRRATRAFGESPSSQPFRIDFGLTS